jgi:hypothetical protein
MPVKPEIINNLKRIAEAEGMVMPVLEAALKKNTIPPQLKHKFGNANNLHEMWCNQFGDKFFKMGTFIRLGSEIENGFRHDYMYRKSYSSSQALDNDSAVSGGVFQRLKGNNTLQDLYKDELNIDLTTITDFTKVQEFMIARHLYAHRAGLLDSKFISDWKSATNEDLSIDQDIVNSGYPQSDVYWFKPLGSIWIYQKAAVGVFNTLP